MAGLNVIPRRMGRGRALPLGRGLYFLDSTILERPVLRSCGGPARLDSVLSHMRQKERQGCRKKDRKKDNECADEQRNSQGGASTSFETCRIAIAFGGQGCWHGSHHDLFGTRLLTYGVFSVTP